MGLNESYSIVHSQILLIKPLPSVNQAYSLLIQEEGQRHNAEKVSLVSKSTALYSGASNQPVQSKKWFSGTCDYCHIKGYKKETCYKLIGYLVDFKFTKKKGTSANSAIITDTSSNSVSASSVSSRSSQVPVFTLEQYQQILELLEKGSRVQTSVHMAGISFGPSSEDWILNAGATNQMTFDLECLSSPDECDSPSFVQLPNGKTTKIAHVGTYSLTPLLTFSKVLHDLCSGKMMGIGKVKGSLYTFHSPLFSSPKSQSIQSSTGIVHQSSCVHTPQQNGVAEPCYLINLLPTSVLDWKSPFEMLHKRVPDLSHLRVFGCLCFATEPFIPQCVPVSDASGTSSGSLAESPSNFSADQSLAPIASPTASSPPPLRRSSRVSKPPSWLSDFVCSTNPSSFTTLLTVKYNSDGSVERFKARLVAKGYNQREWIDFHDTFSPVAKQVIVHTVIFLVTMFNWPLFQMDVFNAFLQGDLHEEQASRQWNLKLTEVLVDNGYIQSLHDYSLFTKVKGNKIVLLLIYVDDLLITENDGGMVAELKGILHLNFNIKDLGHLKYFLGIEVVRSKEGIVLHQKKYALELIADLGLRGACCASTPLEQNAKYTTADYDKQVQGNTLDGMLEDVTVYQRLIGILLYLTHTRPDITFAVQHLSQFMQAPKKVHYEATLQIVRSITGYCIKLGDSLICWKSKKQNTVSCSSAEAEYRYMASTVAELVWLKGLIEELGIKHEIPAALFCDSQAALQIAANPVFHERTKHIEIDCHFVREKIQKGVVQTSHVSTKDQQADIFSKGLCLAQHDHLVSKLGMKDVYHSPT
ncbi:hypothetical protein CXB51_024618 [Gossypium anomalum]|uniref:Reverse transcriptase Ty1/copia-type domain-containing protein n=1 Tax=Gossypium anomalum TaxID=47600 RepID=A0A8J5Y1D2_9ROSI|nr:hypothetical protein CXB51_024618 [Gossypium anomalum]